MKSSRPRMGEGSVASLPEWQRATSFASSVEGAATALALPKSLEWLRYLLLESGKTIPAVIAEAWRQQFLAEYLLGLYEALDHVALLEYYLLFLRSEGYLTTGKDARASEEDALSRE